MKSDAINPGAHKQFLPLHRLKSIHTPHHHERANLGTYRLMYISLPLLA
jgi:hypothetical protein